MKVLVWFPINVKGGGARLFINLISALSRNPEIEKIKVVLSVDCKSNAYFEALRKIDSINIYYHPEYVENYLNSRKEDLAEIDAQLNELKLKKESIEGKIEKLKKEIIELKEKIIRINEPILLDAGFSILKKIFRPLYYMKQAKNYINIINQIKTNLKYMEDEEYKLLCELNKVQEKIVETERKKEFKLEDFKNFENNLRTNTVDFYAQDCDVVYFFWPHFIDFQNTSKPSVCTFQDATILDFPENIGGYNARIFWESSQKWLKKTTYVVTSSHYVKDRLVHYFGGICNSIVVIPHRGLPFEFFPSEDNDEQVLKKHNLPDEYIIYPGNLGFHKNHYNLFVAYSRFKYRSKYPLVIFGWLTELLRKDPPDYPELINCSRLVGLIHRLGLKHGKDFFALGYIDDKDVPAIIKNAKFLVMPSLSEGGGSYPVEEALRMGVPVACSDIPVMREHLANRTAKISWFDPESIDSMADAMNEIIERYKEYKESTVKGMNDPTQSWNEIADEYVKVFKRSIEKFKMLN